MKGARVGIELWYLHINYIYDGIRPILLRELYECCSK